MKRRTAIRNFVLISAGVALFPYCKQENGKVSIALKKIRINPDQEELLEALTQTIIPTTETPGAKEVSAHLFALTMVDDCFNSEEQEKFTKGMMAFTDWSRKSMGTSFTEATPEKRNEFLSKLTPEDKSIPDDVKGFYNSVRQLTLQAYTTSEYYMTNVTKYKMLPGTWHGCVPLNKPA